MRTGRLLFTADDQMVRYEEAQSSYLRRRFDLLEIFVVILRPDKVSISVVQGHVVRVVILVLSLKAEVAIC